MQRSIAKSAIFNDTDIVVAQIKALQRLAFIKMPAVTNFSDFVIGHVQIPHGSKKIGVDFAQVLDNILGQR